MQGAVPAAAAVTLASGPVFSNWTGIDALSAIEHVIGRQGNHVLTGNGNDNVQKLSNKLAKQLASLRWTKSKKAIK